MAFFRVSNGGTEFPDTLIIPLYSGDGVNMTGGTCGIPYAIYSHYTHYKITASNAYTSNASVTFNNSFTVSWAENARYNTKYAIGSHEENYMNVGGRGASNSGFYLTITLTTS